MDAPRLLRVFPNPATGHATVEYRIDRAFREAKIEVVDLLGRVVYSRPLTRDLDTISLPLTHMPGLYMVAVVVDGQLYHAVKLLVQ
jgi:hypothetical protein